MKHITTYHELGRTFYIVKDNHGFWGIESKYFDSNGRLTKEINGVTGHLNKDINDTLHSVSFEIKFEDKMANGMDEMDALRETAKELTKTA